MVFKPRKTKGLVPARNKDDVGLANEEDKKFYKLDMTHMNIWNLCDGKSTEEEIAQEFLSIVKQNVKKGFKIKKIEFVKDVKTILNKLRKYGLIE